LKVETVSAVLKTEDRFENGLVKPARGSGVPRPASPADVGSVTVYVSSHDIRFNPVTLDGCRFLGMPDGADDLE